MTQTGNRKTNQNDTWLTPPEWIAALGPFDFDPCCPSPMPWRTAASMVHFDPTAVPPRVWCTPNHVDYFGDGLRIEWRGRVWCNPPYSKPLAWVEKMRRHRNGFLLLPAKSPETKWGQLLLATGDAFLFIAGREPFHYEDGSKSEGSWNPYVLAAYGSANVEALERARLTLRGVLLRGAL